MGLYRVAFVARNDPSYPRTKPYEPTREVVTRMAGCVDEADAKRKVRALYDVVGFKTAKEVETE